MSTVPPEASMEAELTSNSGNGAARAISNSKARSSNHVTSFANTDDLLDDLSFEIDITPEVLLNGHASAPRELAQPELTIDGSVAPTLEHRIEDEESNQRLYLVAKRVLDILGSVFLLVLLSPLLLFSALVVKLSDGGSVFYPHLRVGELGREFLCYKFRSMVVNAESMKSQLAFFSSHSDQRTFKIPDDPRVTWYGKWMRLASIDELPQLWNVLKGDMSLVGPRPALISEVEQYCWDDMQRLAVKPGLTCIWQVSGRSRLPFPEQLKMDVEYIEKRCMALDLKLIALTIPAVLTADGAY